MHMIVWSLPWNWSDGRLKQLFENDLRSSCKHRALYKAHRIVSFADVQGCYFLFDAVHDVGVGVSFDLLRSGKCQSASQLRWNAEAKTYGIRIVAAHFACPHFEHVFAPSLYEVLQTWHM